jgi:hypothetical protein
MTIPAVHALIGAITTQDYPSHIARIVVLDARAMPESWIEHPLWAACHFTTGACYRDWMKPGDRTMTPEWVFGEFAVFHGFADSAAMEQAIAEFATIEECAWARAMLPTEPTRTPTWRLAPGG